MPARFQEDTPPASCVAALGDTAVGPDPALAGGFEVWLDAYGDAMYGFACRLVGDRGLAEDVVQESLLAAWRAEREGRGWSGGSTPQTWLLGIVRHKAIDALRQRVRERAAGGADAVPALETFFDRRGRWKLRVQPCPVTPAQAAEHAELAAKLERCIDDLPGALGPAFRLREIAGETADGVCQVLGITATNLWMRLHRARLWLRACLERAGVDPPNA